MGGTFFSAGTMGAMGRGDVAEFDRALIAIDGLDRAFDKGGVAAKALMEAAAAPHLGSAITDQMVSF